MAKSIESQTRAILAKYPTGFKFPKYRLHKPSGRAVVQYRPLWGMNPHYLPGVYGDPDSLAGYASACDAIYAHKLAELQVRHGAAEPSPCRDNAKVGQFALEFLRWAAKEYADQPRELNHFRMVVQALAHIHNERVRNVGPVLAKEVRAMMIMPQPPTNGRKQRTKPISRNHVNAQFNRMRAMFKWGIEHEYVSPDQYAILKAIAPLKPGKTEATERPDVQPVPWEEVELVLPFMAPILAIAINIQRLTGMRSDELTAMRLAEIDRTDAIWVYRPETHKTKWRGKSKVICLGPIAQALLLPLLDRPADEFMFKPGEVQLQRNALRRAQSKTKPYGKRLSSAFDPSTFKPRYDSSSYAHALNFAKAKAKKFAASHKLPVAFTDWTPHRLRHLRATEAREKYSLEGAQVVLGNSREATQIYAEVSLPLAKQIAAECG